MKTIIAKYQPKGSNRHLTLIHELFNGKNSYYYEGTNCGGNLGYIDNDNEAIRRFEDNQVKYFKMDFSSVSRVI